MLNSLGKNMCYILFLKFILVKKGIKVNGNWIETKLSMCVWMWIFNSFLCMRLTDNRFVSCSFLYVFPVLNRYTKKMCVEKQILNIYLIFLSLARSLSLPNLLWSHWPYMVYEWPIRYAEQIQCLLWSDPCSTLCCNAIHKYE